MKSEPCRRSVKTFGAVGIGEQPKWHFSFAERFNASTFLDFLKQVVRRAPRKVFMVLDNVRYHHAKLVQAWVASNTHRIELFFLPPYSPEFNATEHVWRTTKRFATHNRHFSTLDELEQTVSSQFREFQRRPRLLRGPIGRWLR